MIPLLRNFQAPYWRAKAGGTTEQARSVEYRHSGPEAWRRYPDSSILHWNDGLHHCVLCIMLLAVPFASASGQSTELDPELDTHVTLSSRARVYLQAKGDRDG